MENKILKKFSEKVDYLNEIIGRLTSWLVLFLVLTTFFVASFRYGFNLGWVWLQELYVWMHGAIIMLGAAYTLLHDGHVRIDIFYRAASDRTKAWINLFGSIFFLMPTILMVGWFIFPYVILSWQRLEASREAGGMHGLFIWKTTMLLFCGLIFLQAISIIIRSISMLAGSNLDSESNKEKLGS